MTKESLRIIYMGTPDFAVESLRALTDGGYNVVAVVTMPDKPAGRGHKIQFSPVKEFALKHNLPLLQPEKLKDEHFIEELRSYRADLQIVVAFRMLPEMVWNMPRLGTFNLHASLLPQYRGAAPINWAVINGETETGATTFFLRHEIDTGNIILQEKLPIGKDENVGSVHDRLMVMGAQLVTQTVDLLLSGHVKTTPQAEIPAAQLHAAPKIFKETCQTDFQKTAQEVHNFVRGLSPYPTAWCNIQLNEHEEIAIKVFKVMPEKKEHQLLTGSVQTDYKTYLKIATTDGFVHVLELQLPGKKKMGIKEVLNGLRK